METCRAVGEAAFPGADVGMASPVAVGAGASAGASVGVSVGDGVEVGASTRSGRDNSPLSVSPCPMSPMPRPTDATSRTTASPRAAITETPRNEGVKSPTSTKVMAARGMTKDANRSRVEFPTRAMTAINTNTAASAAT